MGEHPAAVPSVPAQAQDFGALAALLVFIAASVWLGTVAQRSVRKGSFLTTYFLGNRGLGAWALALTATVQSGGTFMGYPSLVYTHGWSVALWIAGYMVVPITGFGVLAKRLAQLSRRTGAITVPDLFRERFGNPILGLITSLIILFFMSFMMVAQFKAGAVVMKVAWPGSRVLAFSEDAPAFQVNAAVLERLARDLPPDVLTRVRQLDGQDFGSAAELTTALEPLLNADERAAYGRTIEVAAAQMDWLYFLGLVVFTLTVVGYTLIGGFLAAVWTDLFQSVMMFVGVVILLYFALAQVQFDLPSASLAAIQRTGPSYALASGYRPGGGDFQPLSLAVSMFFMWVFAGLASPAGMVRLMASKNTQTIRRSVFLLSVYNLFIYLPLVVICVIAAGTLPPLFKSDEVIPRMALVSTSHLPGGSLVAGLVLAAPFGAVMATVSSYLVVIASGLVRDVYLRFVRPNAGEPEIRWLTRLSMLFVGVIAVAANIRPVEFLQSIVVFCAAGQASAFVAPAIMAAYWRRASAAGVLCAMLAGAGTVLGLWVWGTCERLQGASGGGMATAFQPHAPAGIDPTLWGLAVSIVIGVAVSMLTRPPDPAIVSRLFDAPTCEGIG